MISVQVGDEYIDLEKNISFSLSGVSPFFSRGSIPGTKIYNISASLTRHNQRVFQFADQLNAVDRAKTYADVKVYFKRQLWKVGSLKLRDVDEAYRFSFHTDSADLALKVENKSLAGVDLGQELTQLNTTATYPDANHVFFPFAAPEFYGDANPEYRSIINNYSAAEGRLYNNRVDGDGAGFQLVPFPYLLYVLDALFKSLGYLGIEGSWTEDENIRRVVIYNNVDTAHLDLANEPITYNRHVPDVGIGSFLIDVAVNFGVVPKINPLTRRVRFVPLADWINADGYTSLAQKVESKAKITPNDADGFKFTMLADDEEHGSNKDWAKVVYGNGKEPIDSQAGSLPMLTEQRVEGGGEWTIPSTIKPGVSEYFGQPLENRSGLIFMLFDGMKIDSAGNAYPQGHYHRLGFSLRLTGTDGIAHRCYAEYMAWKTYTEKVERQVELSVQELLQLDMESKYMADRLLWFIAEWKTSIRSKGGLQPAAVTFYKVKP